MLKIIVGAGDVGKEILNRHFSKDDECLFYDNDRRKWGRVIEECHKVIDLKNFIEVANNLENMIIVAGKQPSMYEFLRDVNPKAKIFVEKNGRLTKINLDLLQEFKYINAEEIGRNNLKKHLERAEILKNSGGVAYEHALKYIDFKKEHLCVPEISSIELTNNCNLKCPNCPNSTLKFHKGYISDEVFYEALKYLPPYQDDTVAVHCMGEPLLHPKMIKYLKELGERKINICMSTNGVLLNEELLRKVLDIYKNVDKSVLYISFHTKKSVENWFKCVDMVREYDIPGMIFYGQVLEHNEDEAHKWLLDLGIDNPYENQFIRHITSHSWAGNVENRKVEYSDIEMKNRIRNCYYLRKRKVAVMWDGTLRGCCYDSNATQNCGNIFDYENADINPYGYELCRCCDPDWITGWQ